MPTPTTSNKMLSFLRNINSRTFPLARIIQLLPLSIKIRFLILSALVLLSAFLESLLVALSGPFFSSLLLSTTTKTLAITSATSSILPFDPDLPTLALTVLSAAAIKAFFLYYSASTSALAGSAIGENLLSSLLHKDYASFSTLSRSEILSLLTTKTNKVVTTINLMLRLIYSLFIILSISLTLFLESPILAISAFLSILSLYIALGYLTKRPLATISKDVNRLSSKQYVFLNDSLGSYIDILLSGSQSHVIRGYRQIDYSLKRSEAFSLFYSLSPRVAIESIALFIIILAFPYITKTPELIPAFASFAIGSQKLLPAAQEIYASWAITRSLTYDIKELSINLTSPSSTCLTGPKKIDNTFSSIELHNVSLTSQGSIRLNPNSLTITRNQWTAVVGPSGCGKTTLLTILLGLQEPSNGSISINGSSINGSQSTQFIPLNQNLFSYVQQKPFLTESNLRDNIIRSEHYNPILMNDIVNITGLTSLVEQLPYGLETLLGFEANLLSGGQKQRVALARSLYQQRPVLVLDESLNALEPDSVQNILHKLRAYLPNLTLVMVTHDPSLLPYFDHIAHIS